jgi:hypothetical protein
VTSILPWALEKASREEEILKASLESTDIFRICLKLLNLSGSKGGTEQ